MSYSTFFMKSLIYKYTSHTWISLEWSDASYLSVRPALLSLQDKEAYRWAIKETLKTMLSFGWTVERTTEGFDLHTACTRRLPQAGEVRGLVLFCVSVLPCLFPFLISFPFLELRRKQSFCLSLSVSEHLVTHLMHKAYCLVH